MRALLLSPGILSHHLGAEDFTSLGHRLRRNLFFFLNDNKSVCLEYLPSFSCMHTNQRGCRILSLQLLLAVGLARSHVSAEGFDILRFSLDKFESGNIQQGKGLTHTHTKNLLFCLEESGKRKKNR